MRHFSLQLRAYRHPLHALHCGDYRKDKPSHGAVKPENRRVFSRTAGIFLARTVAAAVAFALSCTPGAAQPREPLEMDEVAPGVFVHQGAYQLFAPGNRGDVSNCGFIVGEDAVAVIDTGGSAIVGEALLAAIRLRTALPVRYVISTHMHPDHIFGNAAFKAENPEFVGHAKLARAVSARASQYLQANKPLLGPAFEGIELVLPDRGIEGIETLDLGGRTIELEAFQTAHTDNDLTVLDPQTGTMFMGDLLFSRHVPALDGSIKGWLSAVEKLSARKLNRVVPGHGPSSMPWPQAVAPQKQYLQALADEIRTFINEGRPLAEAAAKVGVGQRDAWLLFDDFNARNVSAAYAELEWE